jgi:putative tryptophan/tyrosine transport system substrate-binding protein
MRRRDFIAGLGSAVASSGPVWAQRSVMPVVGYLYPGSAPEAEDITAAFNRGLNELGFVEGRNVAIEYRFANNDPSRIPELVADLVRRKVTVLAITGGRDGVHAAKGLTATIPIVFEIGNDPVEDGLVTSFSRPGGNLTGVTAMNIDVEGKRLSLLASLAPTAIRIGALTTSLTGAVNQARMRELPRVAAALGRQFEFLVASDSDQIDGVFASLKEKQIGALYVGPYPTFGTFRVQIAIAAASYKTPAIYAWRSFVEAGGLMSYGASSAEDWRLVGNYVGRVLKGEKPADLPVLQPTKFELVINLKTAKALGLTIPETLLATADEVIQ